jgi:hypothetical protein
VINPSRAFTIRSHPVHTTHHGGTHAH